MTSNIGSELILQAKKIDDKVKNEIEKQLHKVFRPEFLNRIDDIVFFNMISKETIKNIAKNHIEEFKRRMTTKNIMVTVSDKAVDFIAEQGYEPEFGARPLKRAIQQLLIVPTSRFLLMHPDTKNIKVDVKDDKIIIS